MRRRPSPMSRFRCDKHFSLQACRACFPFGYACQDRRHLLQPRDSPCSAACSHFDPAKTATSRSRCIALQGKFPCLPVARAPKFHGGKGHGDHGLIADVQRIAILLIHRTHDRFIHAPQVDAIEAPIHQELLGYPVRAVASALFHFRNSLRRSDPVSFSVRGKIIRSVPRGMDHQAASVRRDGTRPTPHQHLCLPKAATETLFKASTIFRLQRSCAAEEAPTRPTCP